MTSAPQTPRVSPVLHRSTPAPTACSTATLAGSYLCKSVLGSRINGLRTYMLCLAFNSVVVFAMRGWAEQKSLYLKQKSINSAKQAKGCSGLGDKVFFLKLPSFLQKLHKERFTEYYKQKQFPAQEVLWAEKQRTREHSRQIITPP